MQTQRMQERQILRVSSFARKQRSGFQVSVLPITCLGLLCQETVHKPLTQPGSHAMIKRYSVPGQMEMPRGPLKETEKLSKKQTGRIYGRIKRAVSDHIK